MSGEIESITIHLTKERLADIPEHLIMIFEDWITKRCRATNTRVQWLDLPLEEAKVVTGRVPPEVADLLCALRVNHVKKIQEIMTKEYE